MPIRFRCAYCNQLMGISRRKAGTVVKCPKCAGEIIVPVPEGMEPGSGPENALEQINVDPSPAASDAISVPTPLGAQPAEPEELRPIPSLQKPRIGVFLSLGALIVSVLVVIMLLVLVFTLGLIIGRQSALP